MKKPTKRPARHSPTEFIAQMDPTSKPGEWRGKYVPAHPNPKKAAAQKCNASAAAAKMVASARSGAR
jgi:hypothetical protein